MKVTKGLGRGLSALFSDTEEAYSQAAKGFSEIEREAMENAENYLEIDIKKIHANPNQPRKVFDPSSLAELTDSIKQHGIITPIVVNKSESGYMIIAGERRWRAAKAAGLTKMPAVVKEYSAREIKEVSLIENLQREDLNAIEAATAMKQLIEEYSLTQEELAERLGKSRPLIANTLRLLTLNAEVIKMVAVGKLSAGHARALVTLPASAQLELANEITKKSLSVREVEQKVKEILNPPQKAEKKPKDKQALSVELKDFVDRFQQSFKTKVGLIGNDNKGRIYIDYYTRDDLDRISDILNILEKYAQKH